MVIDGKKQAMDEDVFDQMVEQPPQPTNPSNQTTETWRKLWQKNIRPRLVFKILSEEIIETLPIPRLRTGNQ